MCVLAFAWRADPKWPLILIGNRDERHDRAATPVIRWRGDSHVIAGVDLVSGGTWLGLTEKGRFAVVTNLRGAGTFDPKAPSRGVLVKDILTGHGAYRQPEPADLAPFNPLNLITVRYGRAEFWTNRPSPSRSKLEPGLYGMSNGGLEDDWPKTRRLKGFLGDWIASGETSADPLLEALADERRPSDEELPTTGLELEAAREVSPIFIRMPVYGTRCSTVVRIGADRRGEFIERRFDAAGQATGETRMDFVWSEGWDDA
jgi:uncharacterized protein with NRDE domain